MHPLHFVNIVLKGIYKIQLVQFSINVIQVSFSGEFYSDSDIMIKYTKPMIILMCGRHIKILHYKDHDYK